MRKMNSVMAKEISVQADGSLLVDVKFNDGRVYRVSFYTPDAARSQVDSSDVGVFATPGLILIEKATMSKVREVLPYIVESGFFDGLIPTED
jgi:hypothetical protein